MIIVKCKVLCLFIAECENILEEMNRDLSITERCGHLSELLVNVTYSACRLLPSSQTADVDCRFHIEGEMKWFTFRD